MGSSSQDGFSLIELIVAFTILSILAVMAVPLARYRVRQQKEIQLTNDLVEMRKAIDKYKDECDKNTFGPPKMDSDCYPESLEILVKGQKKASDANGKKIKFLRRIPKDPFTGDTDWGKRSDQDDPDADSWGGQNVFDIYTKTMEKAADGTPYSQW